MSEFDKTRSLLATLSPIEKVRVLEWILRDLGGVFPGIESDPAVAGGSACVLRTRIPVWVLVRARQLGLSEAEILNNYPALRAEDLVHAWNYYGVRRDEIDRQIHENEAA